MIVVRDLTEEDFSGVQLKDMDDDKAAFVLFYASWCQHCKAFEPVYQKIANIIGGVVETARADVDKVKGVADALDIQHVPLLVYFPPDDGVPERYNGDMTWRGVLNFLSKNECKKYMCMTK